MSFRTNVRNLCCRTRFLPEPALSEAEGVEMTTLVEMTGVGQFVVAVAEIVDLDAAFGDQRIEAEIDFAKADAQPFRQVPLRKSGVLFQGLEQTVMGGVV